MALEDLVKSYDEFLKTIPQDDFYWQVKESKRQIEQRIGWQKIYPSSILKKVGLNYNQLLTDYQQTANGPKDLSLSKNLSPAETSQQVLPSYMESQPWEKPMGGSSPMNGPVNITHNNDNSINIYPSIGNFEPNRMDFNE
ncbi:MAG TPA: hypothetical protein DCP47_07190 [Phycisphaerales bacterium]|nr:hypothetical protein [Phycisphaerales bacterium]